jgi:hypothetical protein
MTVPIGLIYVDLLTKDSFSCTLETSKYFKLAAFSAHQSHDRITRVVETEANLFLGKCIITL